MVIAGGDWQIELVKKAKRMGYYVICSNLYKNSPAFPFADACEVADILDKDKNLAIAKKYKPDAVISDQSDLAVPTVAYLNEKLGLPGIGKEKAALFTDKFLLREYCRKNSITIPDYKICCCSRDAEEMLDKYGKIIIKPIDSQSSRGVFSITTRSELKNHYLETISYSNKRSEFLAEEYIDGDEFTIDGLVINGNHFLLCISIKDMYQKNPNISRMQTYTYSHPVYNYDQLRRANHDLIMKIGLPFGLTHTEYKFHFMENFNYPYISKSVTEFWRRWHISLSSWFRDYVYIPLGGSRCNTIKLIRNLFIVWSLTGIWHGANWTFILWGVYYFFFLLIEKYFNKQIEKLSPIIRYIATMLIVLIGWIIFRSPSVSVATYYLQILIGYGKYELINDTAILYLKENLFILICAATFSVPIGKYIKPIIQKKHNYTLLFEIGKLIYLGIILIFSISFMVKGSYNPFIYFNF